MGVERDSLGVMEQVVWIAWLLWIAGYMCINAVTC